MWPRPCKASRVLLCLHECVRLAASLCCQLASSWPWLLLACLRRVYRSWAPVNFCCLYSFFRDTEAE
jgi:hypothetical protein